MKRVYSILAVALLIGQLAVGQKATGVTYDKWETVSVTDDFGDPTGDSVSRLIVEGTFNNSATIGSEMTAKMVFESESEIMYFQFLEYNRSWATFYGDDPWTLKMKINGETVEYSLDGLDDMLYLLGADVLKLVTQMEGATEPIKVVIKEGTNLYSFTIPAYKS